MCSPGLERRIEVRAHPIAVEMDDVGRRLARVVEVRDALPDAILLAHLHVIHLLGQISVERRSARCGRRRRPRS